jgi:hypothetical protein
MLKRESFPNAKIYVLAPIVEVQCWIALTALGWNLRQLARSAKVSAHTIARFGA